MKVVIGIPYYETDIGKREVLQKCVNSLEGQGQIVILAGRQPTLPNAWNQLLRIGFGMGATHVVLSNDDIILDKGNIADLCKTGVVESPTVNGGVFKVFHAHIFAVPKEVYEKVGDFDERFEIYWSDTDWAKRLVDLSIPVTINAGVNVIHSEPGRTIGSYKGSTERSDEDKFREKWGRLYHDPVTGV